MKGNKSWNFLGLILSRNEAVLLFSELCEDNQDLPVLFAFESGFELLIHIFESESWAEGGVVVQDCLKLMWFVLNKDPEIQGRMQTYMKKMQNELAPEKTPEKQAA